MNKIFMYILGGGALLFLGWFFFAPWDAADEAKKSESSVPPSQQDNEVPVSGEERETLRAVIETEKGDITLDLYPSVAPKTVENFATLAQANFYNGTKWHRVIDGFMIQGGDPLSKDDDPSNDGTGGPGYTFEDEINPWALGLSEDAIASNEQAGYLYLRDLESLPNDVGAISMANSGANTNGSQFFIITSSSQPHLDGRHTVFGKVVGGLDIVLSVEQGDVIKAIRIENPRPVEE